MSFALLVALISIAGGAGVTYLYDDVDATLASRLCAGACIGTAALGLAGFILASLIGLTPLTISLAALLVASPLLLLLLLRQGYRAQVLADVLRTTTSIRRAVLHPTKRTIVYLIFYVLMIGLMWSFFSRAAFERAGEIYTGVDNNLGDLPLHIGIIEGFVQGKNFPPEHPEFAGARFTYPFLVDFVAAMFTRLGASLSQALFLENIVLAVASIGLLHRWALKLTSDRLAALISPVLILLSGGIGWKLLAVDMRERGQDLLTLLQQLPHDYTINIDGLRWGNALTTLLVTQRSLLLGLPLCIIVWTLWWQALSGEEEQAVRSGEQAESGRQQAGYERESAGTRQQGASRGEGAVVSKGRRRRVDQQEQKARGVRERSEVAAVSSTTAAMAPAPNTLAVRGMIAAGAIAGLLPLIHAHSFIVMMGMGGCLALLFRGWWRAWIIFFVLALAIAGPQILWVTRDSAVHSERFLGWHFGWDRGEQNAFSFWFNNTGLFIPLLIVAMLWGRGWGAGLWGRKNDDDGGGGGGGGGNWAPKRPAQSERHRRVKAVVPPRLLLFYLPFTLCFIGPNLIKLAPWVWDNIKVLYYWYVASVPLVAMLLARLWRAGGIARRSVAATLFASLILAGSLDVWRVVSNGSELLVYGRDTIKFAETISSVTPPRALILHQPTYNHPVFLSGRRSLIGYAGHLWTHGLDYAQRAADVQRIFAGAADADQLLLDYGVDYVILGPAEEANSTGMPINEQFFRRYPMVGEAGEYRLYKITRS